MVNRTLTTVAGVIVAASLALLGCGGSKGDSGSSCTVTDNADGTATITCDDGSEVTIGGNAGTCSVTDNGDGTSTISCDDGTTVTVSDGGNGDNCSAVDNGDGTYTITCGTDQVVVGDGGSCAVTDNGDGTITINCDDGTSVTVTTYPTTQKTNKHMDFEITEVSVAGGALTVSFSVHDNGSPITNMTMDPIRIMVNQLAPAANAYDSDVWSEDFLYERGSTTDADLRLVQTMPGHYTYTFLETVADAVANDGADPALQQQVAMRIRRFEDYYYVNDIYQMTGLPTTDGQVGTEVSSPVRQIVTTEACNDCHGPRIGHVGHGGGYNTVEYCSNCHTVASASRLTNGADMTTMIHQIHSAIDHTNGGADPGHDFSHVTYTQDMRNCNRCHQGQEGQNWNTKPTILACVSCHTGTTFDAGTATHTGGAQADNSSCATCHAPTAIQDYHLTDPSTPFNPDVPAGLVNTVTYVINSITMNGDVPTVNFSILADGVAMVDLDTTYPPTGYSGSPSFLMAYALPQGGIAEPADWNNMGEFKNQAVSTSITNLFGTANLVAGPNAGEFEAILPAFPAGATMRAVAMQGYFYQEPAHVRRRTTSVVMGVPGDEERRAILNIDGCMSCHERLELHGGSRVLSHETDMSQPNICVMCHVPNLSSSGNTFDMADYIANPGNYNSSTANTIATYGNDPFTWPEEPQNFKDMIHGIHSSSLRDDAYDHVRIRSGNAYSYDWSHATFPRRNTSNCSTCHLDDSYELSEVPAGALPSIRVTGTPTNQAEALSVRDGSLNADDTVHGARVAACYSCHNSNSAVGHMTNNGGLLSVPRTSSTDWSTDGDQCLLCHGSGRLADVAVMHEGLTW